MNKTNKIFSKAIAGLSFIIYLVFAFFLCKHNILPIKYRSLVLAVLFIIFLIYGILSYKNKIKGIGNIIFLIILLIITIAELIFMSYVNTSIKTINEISQADKSLKTEMSYIVRKDSAYKDLEDIKDLSLAIAETEDNKILEEVLGKYKDQYKKDLRKLKYIDYLSLGKSLLRGKEEVILLNESFRSLIDEAEEDFSKNTRKIGSVLVENRQEEKKEKEKVALDDSFNVYISGIDTYGSLSNVSRSDVNLVVSVNPTRGKVLITTIPRDSYVNIPGKGMDKLTHAGLFGVDSSIETIENLFDIKIDYFGKVNFTTLTELIDVLGGIDVESPRAFTAQGYNFVQGTNHLDGDMALAFARDRYHQAEGDFDRGKNHTRIIEAIIRKMLRPEILLNFGDISQVALKSVNTDMPYEKMIELVNKQIDSGTRWDIESQALSGSGTMDQKSVLMPDAKLYMMIPSDESVKEVEGKIKENNK
ncbi:LCP family protein [uncultured Anaerococcus sp.]|uniref:LCP family protein n=1 Tax=uncultured Anaerococcus sp. TaxID=293428 RepID=UPI0025E3CAAD|nr:LCP family protein [uncultured Anaerococcus sp.]